MVLLQAGFSFQDSVNYLVSIGVYDYFLPFLLVFAIVFAILEKTKILGQDKANINAIVALVVGLLLIVQRGIVDTINLFLPRVSLIIVVVLMGLLIIAMIAGKEYKGIKGATLGVAIIITILAVLYALSSTPVTGGTWLSQSDREALIRIGVPLLVFFGIIWFVTSKPSQPNQPGGVKKFLRELAGDIEK